VTIDVPAGQRVAEILVAGGLLKEGTKITGIYDTSIAG
jgi:hypothetical protein